MACEHDFGTAPITIGLGRDTWWCRKCGTLKYTVPDTKNHVAGEVEPEAAARIAKLEAQNKRLAEMLRETCHAVCEVCQGAEGEHDPDCELAVLLKEVDE